jgi:hypothetical protein
MYDDEIETYLMDLAEPDLKQPSLAAAGSLTGVGLPDNIQPGSLLSPNEARKLGAQLIRLADLHDVISNGVGSAAWERVEQRVNGDRQRLAAIAAAAATYFREFDHLVGSEDYPERRALREALGIREGRREDPPEDPHEDPPEGLNPR